MEDKFYSSNCADKGDCISKPKSNLSLSGGYFPYEDSSYWKDSTSSEDSTSEASFCYFLPPVQESRGTESGRMPTGRQEQIHADSEQLCELPIVQVLDVYLGSHYEDSLATRDLHGDYQWMDKYPRERMNKIFWKLEVLMRYLKVFPDNLRDEDDEDEDDDENDSDDEEDEDNDDDDEDDEDEDEDDDHVFSDSFLDEDLQSSTSASLNMYQISRETDTEDTLSVSSGQSTEGDTPSHSESTSCLNIRSMVHWVVSSLLGRARPDTASKDPSLRESKKRCFHRGKRIQPW